MARLAIDTYGKRRVITTVDNIGTAAVYIRDGNKTIAAVVIHDKRGDRVASVRLVDGTTGRTEGIVHSNVNAHR